MWLKKEKNKGAPSHPPLSWNHGPLYLVLVYLEASDVLVFINIGKYDISRHSVLLNL
jgi:hypothetical protein